MDDDRSRCAWCYTIVPSALPEDEEGWRRAELQHAPDCPWVAHRGFTAERTQREIRALRLKRGIAIRLARVLERAARFLRSRSR
jgi:hypothetical protein